MAENNCISLCRSCTKCGADLVAGNKYKYGKKDILCERCFDAKTAEAQECPNCGQKIIGETDSIGLLLTPVGSTPEQKRNAIEVLVIICPKCRILFFDEYHYNILEGLKRP